VLPAYFKIRVFNDAGVSVTVQVDFKPYAWSGGTVAYGSNSTIISSGAVSSAASVSSAAQDNHTSPNAGGHLTVFATATSPTGDQQLIVYLLGSNDNTTFEDLQATVGEGKGTVVGYMPLNGASGSALHQQFEV
jgi:hypothetical protein